MLFIMSQLGLTLPTFYYTVSDFFVRPFFCLNNYHQFHFTCEIIIRLLLDPIFIPQSEKLFRWQTKHIWKVKTVALRMKWRSNRHKMKVNLMPITFNFNWIRLSVFKKEIVIDFCYLFEWKTFKIKIQKIRISIPFSDFVFQCFSCFYSMFYLLSLSDLSFCLFAFHTLYNICFSFLSLFFFSISRWNRRLTARQTVSITAMTI